MPPLISTALLTCARVEYAFSMECSKNFCRQFDIGQGNIFAKKRNGMFRLRISGLPFAEERFIYDPVSLETTGSHMFAFVASVHAHAQCFGICRPR
jgi:hypothetical protein